MTKRANKPRYMQDLLQDCLSMDDTGLRDYVTSSKDALSMDFMMWLKAR